MKKLLMMCAVLVSAAGGAHAGIDLSWDGCTGSTGLPAVRNKDMLCDGTGIYEIYGQVQPSSPVPAALGLEGEILFGVEAGELSGFWEWESGGTNEGTLVFTDRRGSTNPNCQALTTIQNSSGTSTTEVFQFTRGPGPTEARLQWAMARTTPLVTTIPAGANLYAFTLIIDEGVAAGAGGLTNCSRRGGAVLTYINIASNSQGPLQEINPGLRDNCIRFNSAIGQPRISPQHTPPCWIAYPTTGGRAWGSVRTIYR